VEPLVPALVATVVGALIVYSIVASSVKRRATRLALERLGFRPCPDETGRILEALRRIEGDPELSCDVRDLRKLDERSPIYHFTKVIHRGKGHDPVTEQEILFPMRRASRDGCVLVVKPTALGRGFATRLIATLVTKMNAGAKDGLERLHRLQLGAEYANGNLIAALGPRDARVFDLIDGPTVDVAKGLGDLGVLEVRFRDAWCSLTSGGTSLPFRLEPIVARIRGLLR